MTPGRYRASVPELRKAVHATHARRAVPIDVSPTGTGMTQPPATINSAREPATRPTAALGVRLIGWFLLSSSLGLVSCQSLFVL